MKITKKRIAEIKKAVKRVCGGKRQIEVGRRTWKDSGDGVGDGLNFLLWGEDNDLDETLDIDLLVSIDTPDHCGFVALDLYCYTTGDDGELDTNCYAFFDDAMLIYCTDDDLGHTAAIQQELRLRGAKPFIPN
mgnify:CR=1 FL=1